MSRRPLDTSAAAERYRQAGRAAQTAGRGPFTLRTIEEVDEVQPERAPSPAATVVRQAARLAVWRALADDAAAPPPSALVQLAELPESGRRLVHEHARRHAVHLAAAAYPWWSEYDRARVWAAAGPLSAELAALRARRGLPAWCYQEQACGHLLDAWSPSADPDDPGGCRVCGLLRGRGGRP
jgi:hypothetical protein